MMTNHNTLLAGVAALALFAGTGIAIAQQGPNAQTGAPGMSEHGAMQAQPAKPDAGSSAGVGIQQHAQSAPKAGAETGGSAALNAKGPTANRPSTAQGAAKDAIKGTDRSAQINPSKTAPNANKTVQNRSEHLGANTKLKPNRSTAQNEQKRGASMHTAQRHERNGHLKGLQGNAAIPMQGSHLSLTPEQRTRIRDTVIDARGAPRVGHVKFDVRVGTLVPRRDVHIVPVPETLVQIDPGWRGFLYFIVRDDVVIVNPRDMRIVAVLPA